MILLSSLVEQRLGETVIFLYDIKLLDEAGIYATGIINVDLTRQCYSTLSLNVMLQVKKWSFPISPRDLLPFQDIPGHSIELHLEAYNGWESIRFPSPAARFDLSPSLY